MPLVINRYLKIIIFSILSLIQWCLKQFKLVPAMGIYEKTIKKFMAYFLRFRVKCKNYQSKYHYWLVFNIFVSFGTFPKTFRENYQNIKYKKLIILKQNVIWNYRIPNRFTESQINYRSVLCKPNLEWLKQEIYIDLQNKINISRIRLISISRSPTYWSDLYVAY